jgi:hypothetical protein
VKTTGYRLVDDHLPRRGWFGPNSLR